MRSNITLLGTLVACIVLVRSPAIAQQPPHVDTARAQLAERLMRQAKNAVAAQPPSLESLEIAQLLAETATNLNPASEEGWRMTLQIAELHEDEPLQEKALRALTDLAPEDEVIRLKMLNQLIEQHQTVEQRIEEYELLLDAGNRDRLGPAVASRLALDLALLQRRAGNNDQFAHWLAEAAALDPSHSAAAALAAGYFRAHVDDPFAEGELLVSLFLADPLQVSSQTMLARHLLKNGAYRGAQRLYSMAVDTHEAARTRANAELVADLAIAQWGSGDQEGALRCIREFQRIEDIVYRRQLQEEQPEMTSLELARQTSVIDPTLAVIRTAIHRRQASDLADTSLAQAAASYESVIEAAMQQEPPDVQAAAQWQVELAWVLAWLEGSPEQVEQLLAEAAQVEALSEAAQARFDGWLALRRDDPAAAIEHFHPFIEDDPAAALGQATAMLAQGRRQQAARVLLALAQSQRDTVIGVWSADMLWDLLGQRVNIGSDTTKKLEDLVAAIPSVVDRFPLEPSTAFSLRITPGKSTFDPYEPVMVDLEITNHAPFAISIDSDGPIRSQVALQMSAEMVRAGRSLDNLRPVVVDIDRRFRLMPRERLTVPVNLRMTSLGDALDRSPLAGAIMRAKATMNFIVTPQRAIVPGLMGSERETGPFRVDGFRINQQWLEQVIAELADEGTDLDLGHIAALAHIAAAPVDTEPAVRRLFSEARTQLTEVYGRLDADTQAWMLSVLPRSDRYATIRQMAQQSQQPIVQLSYIMYQVTRQDDPMLAAAERSSNSTLRRLAVLLRPGFAEDATDSFDLPMNN